MEGSCTKGVLNHLDVLKVQARSRRCQPQQQQQQEQEQQSRVKELKAKVAALRLQREQLSAEIQTSKELRSSLDKLQEHEGEEEMDQESEESQLLRLMTRHTQLKDLLNAHRLIGGYDVVKTREGKGVCVSLATAYEGVYLDTYNLQIDLKPTVRIVRHNIPPVIPLNSLAEQHDMKRDLKTFLDALHRHLNAFAGRKQQLKLVKPQLPLLRSNEMHPILQSQRFLLRNTRLTAWHRCCSSFAKMMRAVCVDVYGGPENLLLRSVPRPRLREGEVLIKVHAAALNRADLLQRRGLYPPPPGESDIIGLEVAGTVETLGSGVKMNWKPDDKVMALLCGGGYAEYVSVPEELLMPVPSNLTFCQAAAIPEAWLTAFQLLVSVAQLKEGEVVLAHAGASGVGTAAVQLVRLLGGVPLVTAGSPEKLKVAEELGAAAGFNYKRESFVQGVHDFTGGKGANVILDCIGGQNWEQNVSSLAMDGRWVLYGTMGGRTVEGDLLGKLLSKRGHLLSSLLRSRSLQYKADLVKAFSHRVLPYFSDQPASLRPVVDSTFSLEDIADAHRHMEANSNVGKIVINVIS
ncbi:quinone oxidoreductase PIG3-like [Mugil cephalus]|uniref:quinone oxidoreductase PIG3-like n=1 Tax=Mugil cephalus TaxID=48193 RepID=UPI001FB61213|nr:quinone oxidoreductase PIG3-like [Mugil cephalus]